MPVAALKETNESLVAQLHARSAPRACSATQEPRLLRQRHLLAARHPAARDRAARDTRRGSGGGARRDEPRRGRRAARRWHVLHQGLFAREGEFHCRRHAPDECHPRAEPEDGYVTVEAGCTWAKLNEALEATGMRTGYWGPLSGVNATVGGALSQNSAFFGSALNGTVADSVLGVTVAAGEWRDRHDGLGRPQGCEPFTRYGGPDLTGMFLGDNGAFGVKVAATIGCCRGRQHSGHLSFGFETMAKMAAAQVEMARTRLVAEGFGIDRTKAEHRRASIASAMA